MVEYSGWSPRFTVTLALCAIALAVFILERW